MKKLWLTSAAGSVVAAFTPAFAADLPGKGPALAPAPVFTKAPFSWNGLYAGVNAGLITADVKGTGFDPGESGSCWADFCGVTDNRSHKGVLAGAQIGYNFQMGKIVLGVEADIGMSNANKSGLAQEYSYGKTGVGALGTARIRLGYAFDRALVYATGGLAYANVKNSMTDTYAYSEWDIAGTPSAAKTGGWRTGFAVGGGIEYAVDDRWSVKAEGLYYDLGKKSAISTTPADGYSYNSGITQHTTGVIARVGLNYRFGGAAAPVVARY